MYQFVIEDDNSQVAQLVQQASTGEEVVIIRDHTPIAKIVLLSEWAEKHKPGGFGSGKEDILYMAEDFDAPLEDFKDYM